MIIKERKVVAFDVVVMMAIMRSKEWTNKGSNTQATLAGYRWREGETNEK